MANGDPTRVTAQIAALDQDERVDDNDVPRVDFKFGSFPALPTTTVPALGADQKASEVALRRAALKPDVDTYASSRTVSDAVLTEDDATVTSATAAFVTGDVGARVTFYNATTGVLLHTSRIASRTSGTSVELEDVAPSSASGVKIVITKVANTPFTPAAGTTGVRLGKTVTLGS
jgi:hypothetical protein